MLKTVSLLRILGLVAASSINYACVTVLMIFWQLDLVPYVLLTLLTSLMIGIIGADIAKSLLYTISGVVIGMSLAAAIYLAPFSIFGESLQDTNAASLVLFSILGKHFLIGLSFYLVGAIAGSFIGENIFQTG
jgi:hypothetical protein